MRDSGSRAFDCQWDTDDDQLPSISMIARGNALGASPHSMEIGSKLLCPYRQTPGDVRRHGRRFSPSPRVKKPGSDTGTIPVMEVLPEIASAAARSSTSLTPYVTAYDCVDGNCLIRYGLPKDTTIDGRRLDKESIQAAMPSGTANFPSPSTRRT